MTQFRVIVTYIRLLFVPGNQNLDYDFPVSQNFFELSTLLSFLVLAAIIVFTIWIFPRKRIIAAGILLFFLMLSVESSVLPIRNVIFEHRLYLPMAGFVLFFVTTLYYMAWEKHKTEVKIILFTVICIFSMLTYKRNMVWKSDITLWSDVVKKSPNKSRAHNNLGESYYQLGMYEKGFQEFVEGLTLDPTSLEANNNVGYYLYTRGKYDEAIEYYKRGLEYYPENPDININMGSALVMAGKPDEALTHYTNAISRNPDNIPKLKAAAAELVKRENLTGAIKFYAEILKFTPDDIDALRNIGKIQLSLNQYEDSASHLSKALQMNPNDAVLHNYLGQALIHLGKKHDANLHFTEALRLNPDFMEARVNLAVCLRAQGKIEEAEEQLNRANILLKNLQSSTNGNKN